MAKEMKLVMDMSTVHSMYVLGITPSSMIVKAAKSGLGNSAANAEAIPNYFSAAKETFKWMYV